MSRILFITQYLPSNLSNGAEIASSCFIHTLREFGHSVTVIGAQRSSKYQSKAGENEVSTGIMTIETAQASLGARVSWSWKALTKSLPITSAKYFSRELLKFVRSRARDFDCFILDHTQMWPLARILPQDRPRICVTHNNESLHYSDLTQGSGRTANYIYRREAALLRRIERDIARSASDVWALTHDDLTAIRNAGEVFTPFSFLPPLQSAPRKYATGLLGMWSWEPNRQGLEWFIREVAPKVACTMPIAIAGGGAPKQLPGKRIACLGFVESPISFFSKCCSITVPAVKSIGIQIKTIDALSLGLRVIGTKEAFRHLASDAGHAVITNDPWAFAKAIDNAAIDPADYTSSAHRWNNELKSAFAHRLNVRFEQLGRL